MGLLIVSRSVPLSRVDPGRRWPGRKTSDILATRKPGFPFEVSRRALAENAIVTIGFPPRQSRRASRSSGTDRIPGVNVAVRTDPNKVRCIKGSCQACPPTVSTGHPLAHFREVRAAEKKGRASNVISTRPNSSAELRKVRECLEAGGFFPCRSLHCARVHTSDRRTSSARRRAAGWNWDEKTCRTMPARSMTYVTRPGIIPRVLVTPNRARTAPSPSLRRRNGSWCRDAKRSCDADDVGADADHLGPRLAERLIPVAEGACRGRADHRAIHG